MKKIGIALLGLLLIFACTEKPSEARQDYEASLDYVLNGHDELMKDMTKVSRLIQQTEPKIDSTEQGVIYGEASMKLKAANDSMFAWMRKFSKEFPDINDKEKTFTDEEYKERNSRLEGFKESLDRMEISFEESIREAETIMKE